MLVGYAIGQMWLRCGQLTFQPQWAKTADNWLQRIRTGQQRTANRFFNFFTYGPLRWLVTPVWASSCVFHQLTGRVCSTRLRPYCLIWMLIVQLGQPLTRSAYRDKTVVVVVLR